MANAYANALGAAFSEPTKPFEVELLVAEVLPDDGVDLYHILYDGSISVEEGYVAIGGQADAISTALSERVVPSSDLESCLRAARDALASVVDREIPPETLEVGGLDRNRGRRKFFRMSRDTVAAALKG
jgi:proteasome alpha subunit